MIPSLRFLLPLLIFSAISPICAEATASPRKPNIIVIFIDDLGYADIGPFFGKEKGQGYATPHLDRLAAEGTKFTSFYAAQAVCSASRAGLLTGCYPNRIGLVGALMPHSKVGLSKDETTIAEICKSQGYATACFGKWHLGDALEFLPLQHGFDEYLGIPYSNDMSPVGAPHGVFNERSHYPPLPLISGNSVVNPSVDDAAQAQMTTWLTEQSVNFITKNKENPFFLYIPHPMVHVPLHVSEKFRGKTKRGAFGDVMEELDWSVGQILAALKKNGIDDNTLVIFTSDNGPWLCFGDHAGSAAPLREGKGTSWDGGVRVPTIMRWPGKIPAGKSCDAPLMTIDLLPTVATLTGGKLPKHKIDGLDISPVITGKTNTSPHEALAFYYHNNELQGLRSGRWKLELPHAYRTLNGKPPGNGGKMNDYSHLKITKPELYDLDADPGQTRDVAAQYPHVMEKLLVYVETFRADMGDDITKRHGSGRRQPGRAKSPIFPKDPAFKKAPNPDFFAIPE